MANLWMGGTFGYSYLCRIQPCFERQNYGRGICVTQRQRFGNLPFKPMGLSGVVYVTPIGLMMVPLGGVIALTPLGE